MMMTIHVRQWEISSGRLRLLLLAGDKYCLTDMRLFEYPHYYCLRLFCGYRFLFWVPTERKEPETPTEIKQPMLGVFSVQLRAPRDVVLRIKHMWNTPGFLCTECLKGFINDEARNPKGNRVIYQGVLLQSKLRTYYIQYWTMNVTRCVCYSNLNAQWLNDHQNPYTCANVLCIRHYVYMHIFLVRFWSYVKARLCRLFNCIWIELKTQKGATSTFWTNAVQKI